MQKYRYLMWDIDGTILNFVAAERAAIRSLFQRYGLGECTDRMLQTYSRINVRYWEALEREEMTKPQILVGRFRDFFAGEGIDPAIAEAFNDDYQIALGDTIEINDDAIDLIREEKRSGSVIIVITNGTAVAQKKKLEDTGLGNLADYIFISEDVGFEKPSRKYFERVLATARIEDLSQALIIGDSLTSDILGGQRMGIDTCWYNPSGKCCSSPQKPTYTIGNLHELETILKDGPQKD